MTRVRCAWWMVGVLAAGCLGCWGASPSEAEWPEQEPSCGGTGEEGREALAAAGCAWPRGPCELAPLTEAIGAAEAQGRRGSLRLGALETTQLGADWDAWFANPTADTLALRRDPDGGLHALGGCRLGVTMSEVPAASADAPPARVAEMLLVATPAESAADPCEGATHFVAVARGDEGVALPLACPPLSFAAAPHSCVGAGLAANARRAWGRALHARADAAYERGDYAQALDGFLTLRALMPDSLPVHYNLAETSARLSEPSCAYRDAISVARGQLPDDGSVARPWANTRCVPAPPLLGCLTGFVSPPSLDHC